MPKVYRRPGSDNYWIEVQVKGRQRLRRSSGTADKKRAEALAQRIEAQEWERLVKGDRASLTFAEAVLTYVEDGKPDKFLAPLVKHFKDRQVAAIGPEDIKAAARAIYPDAKPATWNRQAVVPARAVINHAAGKNLAAYIRVANFRELRPVRKAPAPDWLPAFMRHAPPRIAALALFMRVTAARIGQAVAMDWSAVDLAAGTAIIPPAKGYPERIARLTAEAVAALANIEGERKGPVFGYVHRWSVYKAWRKVCTEAGIAAVMPHDAGRRAFATAMREAGVDPKTAAKRGGWSSIRLMLDVYSGEDEDPALIDRVFGTIPAQPKQKKRTKRSDNK